MIKDYFTGVPAEFEYIIKVVGFEKKSIKELIERFFEQYKILDLDVKETPIQKNPMEFPSYNNMSVVIAKITTAYRWSPDYCRQQFCQNNSIPESMVIFRTKENPLEVQDNQSLVRNELMKKGALLSTDPNYKKEEQGEPQENFVGTLYTNKLLAVMKEIQDSKKIEMRVDAPSPLFSWLQMDKVKPQEPVQDTTNFNSNVEVGKKIVDTLNSGANKSIGEK